MDKKDSFGLLYDEMNEELINILEFWSIRAVDQVNGGFVGQIGPSGNANTNASKGVVLNTRILWTFSSAYRTIGSDKLERLAQRAFDYIVSHFWDKDNGGLFWELDHRGKPLNTRKQAYAQGFGLYAFSEFFRATGNKSSLDYAIRLYELIEKRYLDKKNGGYIEALAKDWHTLEDMRLSAKEDNLPKSMNTHLHILEPYTNLYRVWPDNRLRESIIHLLKVFQQHIVDPETGHFTMLFDLDWTRRCEIVSYGHEIEGAWLLNEAASLMNEPGLLEEIQNLSLRLVDNTLEQGLHADGSVFYERTRNHLDSDRHWWPQAEALVGLTDAWEITGNVNYFTSMQRVWKFIKENMIDYENGEWFWDVDINGFPNEDADKAGFWKCPYHNSRAMLEMMHRLQHKIAQTAG